MDDNNANLLLFIIIWMFVLSGCGVQQPAAWSQAQQDLYNSLKTEEKVIYENCISNGWKFDYCLKERAEARILKPIQVNTNNTGAILGAAAAGAAAGYMLKGNTSKPIRRR